MSVTGFKKLCTLAPMAGEGDRSFRSLCMSHGAAFCTTEMVSAKGLVLGDRESGRLLELTDAERPVAIQLFGRDPEIMRKAASMAAEHKPQAIDINMGCPAPKITGSGAGSALMREPELCGELVAAVSEGAGSIPVTVKMRTGVDEQHKNFLEVARQCVRNGAASITLHARTRERMYAPPAEWDKIAELKRSVSVPVIGNGDVTSAEEARRMLDETGCDMVSIGRAALGNPWIFEQANAVINGVQPPEPPTLEEKMQVMRAHITDMCRCKGEYIGMREARRHCAFYMRGLRGAPKLRRQCVELCTLADLDELIKTVLSTDRTLPY